MLFYAVRQDGERAFYTVRQDWESLFGKRDLYRANSTAFGGREMLDKVMGSDNRFHRFMGNLFYMTIVNILWIVCCLPVFTFGASTTAMYAAAFKIIRGKEGKITEEFFTAFRRNFRQALPITVIMLFTAALLATGIVSLRGMEEPNSILYGVLIFLIVAAIAVFCYVYPLLAVFDNTTPVIFNNAWRLALTNLPVTIMCVILNAFLPLLVYAFPGAFAYVIGPWILFGFALAHLIDVIYLYKIFKKYIPEDEKETEMDEEEKSEE